MSIIGTQLGRYEIRSLLGAGGMGEVYLAQDTRLGRAVALKLLSDELTKDETRVRRFEQEARAASALNHPNIITIHEIGSEGGAHFIATEFIDGETLRERMSGARMKVGETLDVAAQIAAALVAAHGAGIIHRDIKPENVMVRRDGYVKVLDFGLAKLTERWTEGQDSNSEAQTRALVNTDPGTVMGTVNYMSPEQASARGVDARTDLWSLGIVLYEMVTGRVAFEGATASHTIVAIMDKEPPPLMRFVRDAPEALEWIVTKALTKDAEERYQTAKEMLNDLRRLKQRLEINAEIERSVAPDAPNSLETSSGEAATVMMTSVGDGRATDATMPQATARSGEAATRASSAEYLTQEIKRHKTGAVIIFSLLLVMIAGAGFALYKLAGRNAGEPSGQMRITRLTSGSPVTSVSISPDGRYIVYATSEAGRSILRVRQITTNSTVEIAPPAEVRYVGATFAPDGEFIYYVAVDVNNPRGALYRVPVLGGTPQRLLTHITSPVTFAPGGGQIAFVRHTQTQGSDALIIANADGSGERVLTTRGGNEWFTEHGPAWSPDGRHIVSGVGIETADSSYMTVIEVAVESGAQRIVTERRWLGSVNRTLWLNDGSGLIFLASEYGFAGEGTSETQIWHLAYPSGEARRITNDLSEYGAISLGLTADSSALVAVQSDRNFRIWTTALDDEAQRPRPITNGRFDGRRGVASMPDGRIVYVTRTGDNQDLWIVNADGSGQRQLTNDPHTDADPAVSPDGRYIVFTSNRAGFSSLWRMDADGGNLRRLTDHPSDYLPDISPDGRWVAFQSWRSGRATLWRVSIDGGAAQQLIDNPSVAPTFSPDGRLIACRYFDETVSPERWRIGIIPAEGGSPVRVLDLPDNNIGRWSPDGRALLYVLTRNDISNFWRQPIDGGAAEQLTRFESERILNFALTRDNRQIIFSRGTTTSDAVLIRDFR